MMKSLCTVVLVGVIGLFAASETVEARQKGKEHTFHGTVVSTHHAKGSHHGTITVRHHHKGNADAEVKTFVISDKTVVQAGGSKGQPGKLHKGLHVTVHFHNHNKHHHADAIHIGMK